MKTVGIIGGLGPDTTTKFYLQIISAFSRLSAPTRPQILIYNVPLPIQIEKEAITEAKDEERCLSFLIEAAKTLEKGGVDFIVMPCNSLHVFIEEIRSAVNIPVLSIVDETVKFLQSQNCKQVGLLATQITIDRKLYKNKLDAFGIEEIVPSDQDQSRIGQIIYHLVIGSSTEEDKDALDNMINDLINRGAKTIVLACTDLQLLIPTRQDVPTIDTMQLLVNTTVKEMLAD